MDKRTEGAWLINHTKKLQDIKGAYDFEDIEEAGKCGLFLSNLAASHNQSEINFDKVKAIANVSGLKKTEIQNITSLLANAKLIETSKNGSISVLGVTTSSVLSHTANIFSEGEADNFQKAALDLSENVSESPLEENLLKEKISDEFRLEQEKIDKLFSQAEEIGLIDFEKVESGKLYFNGNLFRKDNIEKTKNVLNTLKDDEIKNIAEVDEILHSKGCMSYERFEKILSKPLSEKLQAIGMYDFNEISNADEVKIFITKPSAFSKYGSPFEEDALDLAKSFVTSLFYGMNFSTRGRGKITMLHALIQKLVNGYEVGPATAIGQDYRILELKRVIELRREANTSMYYMKLLKKDIGELALQVLEFGDASEQSLLGADFSGNVINYAGPEEKRTYTRKKQTESIKGSVAEILRTFRN